MIVVQVDCLLDVAPTNDKVMSRTRRITGTCMRDLILSVLSLEGLARKKLTDDSSFKLTVKSAETID